MWLKDWIHSHPCSQNWPFNQGNTRGFNRIMKPMLVSPHISHACHQWPTIFINSVCLTIGPPQVPPRMLWCRNCSYAGNPLRSQALACGTPHACRYGFLSLPVTLFDKNQYPTWSQMGKCCTWPLWAHTTSWWCEQARQLPCHHRDIPQCACAGEPMALDNQSFFKTFLDSTGPYKYHSHCALPPSHWL